MTWDGFGGVDRNVGPNWVEWAILILSAAILSLGVLVQLGA